MAGFCSYVQFHADPPWTLHRVPKNTMELQGSFVRFMTDLLRNNERGEEGGARNPWKGLILVRKALCAGEIG